ncbi:MAG: helix-turn-helix transcriptional regulator [Deltaproteobacteria bacterium]|nr:helix-turn-helix transcriptional regulator [Deltaproteobacteria bacterium]MBW2104411.1 helix-turn-helix transcriptional regulator [Deltaproteobacteria bacterium]MBW2348581.1 helix-turn-helix transcriptional regulator [Deltaproteobacteria bacterium]RLB39606.1 MAG: DNA-binding protein [Deltaproteobacteria bacterium]
MQETMLMNTRQVARFLDVNEKVVYSLISEKGLPATKVTGKWLFPRHLVERWVENRTINYPRERDPLPPYHGLLIIAGSNDILLERAISLYNRLDTGHVAVFGNMGSLGGIRALRQNLCHMACSHLLQENGDEYNFLFAREELEESPAVVNFCRREQGLLLCPGNPRGIQGVSDLCKEGVRVVNRATGTGTRLLFDKMLQEAEISPENLAGYDEEKRSHMEVGLEVLAGRADAGPGIRAVAGLLGLEFIPFRWERFDFIVSRERFFDRGIQRFLGLLHEKAFRALAEPLEGYDLAFCGKMVYPKESNGGES